MQVKLTVADPRHDDVDVAVTGPSGTTLGDLSTLLTGRFSSTGTRITSCDGRPLADTALLGGPDLRSGCRILLGGNIGNRSTSAGAVLQARIVGGPDAGRIFPLVRGRHLIGRAGSGAEIQIDDPDVSRRHAELVIGLHAPSIKDLGSTNGTMVDGAPLGDGPTELSLDSFVQMGNSMLSVVTTSQPPALVRADGSGGVLVHRPPRIPAATAPTTVDFPAEVTLGKRPQVRWLTALLPTVVAIALALGMHSSQFLAFALLSPATVFTAAVADRRDWRRDNRTLQKDFALAEQQAQVELDSRLAAEIELRRSHFADPAAVLHTVAIPDCRLWERRPLDSNFLQLRLGIADQIAETMAIRGGTRLAALQAPAVPVTVSLTNGPLGVAGPLTQVRGTARWLVAQILACHAPCDVHVVALVEGTDPDWRWLRWPPGVSTIVSTREQRRQLLDELNGVIHRRRTARTSPGQPWSGPWTVLLIDPVSASAELAGFREVLEHGSAFGITAICVAEDTRLLPRSCRNTAGCISEVGALLEVARPGMTPLRAAADRVSLAWSDEFGRHLAPLADLDPAGRALADRADLLELLGPSPFTAQSVRDRWRRRPGHASCPIGLSGSGCFELDLVRDGPHVLIAGTTGSGKSELLRTMVFGLAASHPPDELSFVLIDYKGGATFSACEELPHVLGMVTDLDAHLTRRALLSLNAELHRREAAFAQAGVVDLAHYRASAIATLQPVPRLVLIVDEFASLADELPDFLSGLLAIAQRGRSLGVHLVLATQRPAGVVSLDIKANMSLRIALRVTDPGESVDVIGDEAACQISRKVPGRALARLADGELVEFHTARVEQAQVHADRLEVSLLDFWNALPSAPEPADKDDHLRTVCAVITDAGRRYCAELPARPWLAPLPELLTCDELTSINNPFEIPYGLTDDPASQRQFVASLDLAAGGAIGFVGGARSGRTTAIRSLMGQAAGRLSAAQLHLYVIDCAGQSFGKLREIPHCGTVAGRHDPASISRLIARLHTELSERHRLLTEAGWESLSEALRAGAMMPVLMVAVDGWDSLAAWSEEYDGGRSADELIRLVRAGPAAGFTFLIAGDRGTLGQRSGSALNRKLLLPMTDRADYAMAGIDPANVPMAPRPGRAVSAEDGLETQLALLAADPSPAAQWAALQGLAIPDPVHGNGPSITIRSLPARVELAELRPATDVTNRMSRPCLLGVGGDDASMIQCDLFAQHSRFLISGPARSGRSNTAVLIAGQARSAGLDLLVAASDWSPLSAWAQAAGCPTLTPDDDPSRLLGSSIADLIVIDDAEQFTDSVMGDQLQIRLARHRGAAVVTARSDDLQVSFRGLAVELRRHRTGLLLQPSPADGELLGIRLGPNRIPAVAGRGLLVTDQTRNIAPNGVGVQIALADV